MILGVILLFILILAVSVFILFSRYKSKAELEKSLGFVLYEVLIPRQEQQEKEKQEKSFKDYVSVMEQFLASVASLKEENFWDWLLGIKPYIVLELALPSIGEETTFYAAIPVSKARFFEKQIQSVFPFSKVEIKADDYNIFNPEGESSGSWLKLAKNPVYPIKTYQNLESDPLEIIASAFSKLKKEGEGAALQIVIAPDKKGLAEKIKQSVEKLKRGEKLEEGKMKTIRKETDEIFNILSGEKTKKSPNAKEEFEKPKVIDEEQIKILEEKAGKLVFSANIRLLASAKTKEESDIILSELEGAFSQFSHPRGNSFRSMRLSGKTLKELFYKFSFRIFDENQAISLNTQEITSVYHFPAGVIHAPKIKFLKYRDAPAPADMPSEGIILGENIYRGEKSIVRIKRDDRRRHLYIIGQTGTGKTEFIKNMVYQDIKSGEGLCVIDPHGDMAESILGMIPEERAEDAIYFNPADTEKPLGLNFLEYDPRYPEQKTFIADEIYGIFRKLWKDIPEAFGPMFEQYYRNAVLLVMEDPASGNTLMEVPRVLAEKSFRDLKLSRCKNPVVINFWREVAEKAGGEAALANIAPYITSKFDVFIANEIMRPIIAQERSAFNFREIMDSGKILVVNLAKGRLGEINSNLLGLILVGKILMASLSRVDLPQESRRDFYFYIDEFHNITTRSISTILAEARKYRLNLIVVHQYIKQLEEEIKNAVFGNIGSIVAFRIGKDDSETLEKHFQPVFSGFDLLNLANFHAYLKLLIDNEVSRPFNIKALPPAKGDKETAEKIKALSRQKYGRRREEIEGEIMKKYSPR
jgi:hypothetical protein